MKIKQSELDIPLDDPFSPDKLERRDLDEPLTQLIDSADGPFVLAVNGGWGQGKSTFLRMWRQSLTNRGFHTLYFNAWETDFVEDPLIAFVGELRAAINEAATNGGKKSLKSKFNKAKKLSVQVGKRIAPVGAKILTAGLITEDILEAISEKHIADAVGEAVSAKIEHYDQDKNTIAAFKKSLEDLAASLIGKSDNKHPIVFFIDELDRCRPTFAIQLLERIKHLFSVTGFVFVLGVDMEQLGHSVKTLYGTNMKAGGYLRRFIDLEFTLPPPPLYNFPAFLIERFGFDQFFDARKGRFFHEQSLLRNIFATWASTTDLSLREQEQCFTRLSIIFRMMRSHEYTHPILLVTLVILRSKHPELYAKIRSGTFEQKEITELLRASEVGREFAASDEYMALVTYLRAAFLDVTKLTELMDEARTAARSGNPKQQVALHTLEAIARDAPIVPRFIKKIELAEQFH